MKTITYLVPVYNSEKFIEKTYQSLADQTYTFFKILFVDDGSSDNSLKIIKNIKEKDSRVEILSNPHKGLVFTLNSALKIIKSDWIIRLDSDDLAAPDRTFKILDTINKLPEDIGLITSDVLIIDEDEVFKKRIMLNYKLIKFQLFAGKNTIYHTTIALNRKLLNTDLFYKNKYIHAEDYELWLRLLSKYKLFHIQEPLVKYRIHNNQVTKKYSNASIKSKYLALKDLINSFRDSKIFKLYKKISLFFVFFLEKIELMITNKQNSLDYKKFFQISKIKIFFLKILFVILRFILIIFNIPFLETFKIYTKKN